MMLCIPKIDSNSLGVTNMQITIRFRWKSSHNLSSCSTKMLLHQFRPELNVFAWLMQISHPTRTEHTGENPLSCLSGSLNLSPLLCPRILMLAHAAVGRYLLLLRWRSRLLVFWT